jgi:hypothetical protein
MGGSVRVKSEQGVGSQFIINLKLKSKLKNHPSSPSGDFEDFAFIFKQDGKEEYTNLMQSHV